MNKFAKGSLAAGAGLVLLLGGAGTLAYWNSEAELKGGTVQAGTLELTADTEQLQKAGPVSLVPGDEQTFTATLDLLAEGENIEGTVALDDKSVVYSGQEGIDPDLAEKFVIDISLAEQPATDISQVGDDIVFTDPGNYTIDVEVTVAMPFGEGVDNSTQGATVDLQKVSFIATQTDPNATDSPEGE